MPDEATRLTNADIAEVLLRLAQLLTAQKENPFKIKAYRRAAKTISNMGESVSDLVGAGADLTAQPGIGDSISSLITEIVRKGGVPAQLEKQRASVEPEIAALGDYPRLDPVRIGRIYRKLGISSTTALRERLEAGDIRRTFGSRMDEHVRQGLTNTPEILLHDAHPIVSAVRQFLLDRCNVSRVEAAGDYRRCAEVLTELTFVVDAADFESSIACLREYGGGSNVLRSTEGTVVVVLPSGVHVRVFRAAQERWGLSLLLATGSEGHIQKLESTGPGLSGLIQGASKFQTEAAVYRKIGLPLIPAELREGNDEVEMALSGSLPELVSAADIRGDLHAHSTSSDGLHTIEQMAEAAQQRGYEYLGITDHSQSLTIARGLSERDVWEQMRRIDELNERATGIRILKSAEVEILEDGSLDYPDALLNELDYTICSIHSKFGLGRTAQTERLLRAMDNRHFNILGHATGRLLLRRPGYEVDIDRIVRHAAAANCFFEINSSPYRLDLSAANARLASEAGVKIAVNTDAHSVRELGYIAGGIEQARRAGLDKAAVLNCFSWTRLRRLLKR